MDTPEVVISDDSRAPDPSDVWPTTGTGRQQRAFDECPGAALFGLTAGWVTRS
jgi:hypothetical protein